MNWLQAALAIIETVSRTVDRIGPVSFEPIDKHPGRAPSAPAPVRSDGASGSGRDVSGADPGGGAPDRHAGSMGFNPSRSRPRAGGTDEPSSSDNGGGGTGGDGGDDDTELRAPVRSMRVPTASPAFNAREG